jgi:hypothetical protein
MRIAPVRVEEHLDDRSLRPRLSHCREGASELAGERITAKRIALPLARMSDPKIIGRFANQRTLSPISVHSPFQMQHDHRTLKTQPRTSGADISVRDVGTFRTLAPDIARALMLMGSMRSV